MKERSKQQLSTPQECGAFLRCLRLGQPAEEAISNAKIAVRLQGDEQKEARDWDEVVPMPLSSAAVFIQVWGLLPDSSLAMRLVSPLEENEEEHIKCLLRCMSPEASKRLLESMKRRLPNLRKGIQEAESALQQLPAWMRELRDGSLETTLERASLGLDILHAKGLGFNIVLIEAEHPGKLGLAVKRTRRFLRFIENLTSEKPKS